MARGVTYSRQELNRLSQSRIRSREQTEARKVAEAKRIASDPRRIELARLQKISDEGRAKYDKLYAETKDKRWSRKSDDLRRKYGEKIRTVNRAISKNISISDQAKGERSKASRQRSRFAQRDALVDKFGTEVYAEMSPEARDYAYAQIQGRTTPTPNTARAKDEANRRQEVRIQSYVSTLKSFDEAQARKEAERSGSFPERSDFSSNAAYSYAVSQYNNTPKKVLSETSNLGGGRFGYQARSFQAGITADTQLASDMGLAVEGGSVAGSGSVGYQLGQIAYLPARYFGTKGAGRLVSGVTGAGYTVGSRVGSTVGSVGGRYVAGGAVGEVVGGTVGAVGFSAPVVLATGLGVREIYSAPIGRELEKRSIDKTAFRSAYAQAREEVGGFGELNPAFTNRERFDTAFSTALSERGVSPTPDVMRLGRQQLRAGAVSDAYMLVTAGAGANVLGARLSGVTGVGTIYRTPIGAFSGGGFRAVGTAGVLEGGVSSLGQNVAGFEPLDPKRALIGAGVGGVSAGVLGGYVAGTGAVGDVRRSGFYESIGFAADPSEFGSDLLTASNPYGSAKVFSVSVPPLSRFEGGAQTRQPTLTEDFGIVRPVPTKPSGRRRSVRDVNPFVSSQPSVGVSPEAFVPVQPAPSSRPSSPFVPSQPVPLVPSQPPPVAPLVPSSPFVPTQSTPSSTPSNPLVGIPVTKLFFPVLGKGSLIPSRKKRGSGVGEGGSRYTASFTAIELGIVGSMPTQKSFTGFEIRPLIGTPRKKTKKKKKVTRKKSKKRKVTRKKVTRRKK